jgi:hypothetical protein
VSVRRQQPPFGVAPISASAINESHRRSPLMRQSGGFGHRGKKDITAHFGLLHKRAGQLNQQTIAAARP